MTGRNETSSGGCLVSSRPRTVPQTRRELNHVSPSGDTPTATLPRVRGVFLQSSNGTATGLVGVGNRVLPPRIAGLSAYGLLSRNSLGRELGGDTAQDCAESLGFAASIVGVRHERQRRSSHVRQAEQAYPKPGEVCRERG
jgi:hypothetical protein